MSEFTHPYEDAAHMFNEAKDAVEAREAMDMLFAGGEMFMDYACQNYPKKDDEDHPIHEAVLKRNPDLWPITQFAVSCSQRACVALKALREGNEAKYQAVVVEMMKNMMHKDAIPQQVAIAHRVLNRIANQEMEHSYLAVLGAVNHAKCLAESPTQEHFGLETSEPTACDAAFFMARRYTKVASKYYEAGMIDGNELLRIVSTKHALIEEMDGMDAGMEERVYDREHPILSQVIEEMDRRIKEDNHNNFGAEHPNVAHPDIAKRVIRPQTP